MYDFTIALNTLTASLFLCILFVIYPSTIITRLKKNRVRLILVITVFFMEMCYILDSIKMDKLILKDYRLLYMFIAQNIIVLIIFYLLSNYTKIKFQSRIIIMLDYIACVLSFILSQNYVYMETNSIIIMVLMIFNLYYFYKKCHKIMQIISVFYLLNFACVLQIYAIELLRYSNTIELLIYSNIIVDFLFGVIIFYKVYKRYIEQPHVKYLKIESNLSRSIINMKIYDERLNNYRNINKALEENYYLKEKNSHIILGQFKKSALLIDGKNYVINNNDIIFKTMFNKSNDKPTTLDDFVNENIVEREKFLKCIEEVRCYKKQITKQITCKDQRLFECIFYLYEEYESSSVICILSDITYENKISLKMRENDIKYKKIAESIPYSIILEKNKEIIYNNNKLGIILDNITVKNIVLNKVTKGEINYIDGDSKRIILYIDRIKFKENNEELNLIEIKDISKYKKLLSELEVSTSEYRTLIDTIPEAICVLDYESKEFEYANDTFFDMFKIQDIENMDFNEIYNDLVISSGNINESIRYIRKTLKDGNGSLINIESSVVLIDVNKSTKMVLIIRDITEEIKVESMKKEIEESENIIKDRDNFFINMSHELLTPANLLHASNQFIERSCKGVIKREPNGEFANCISIMKNHVEILITLINKIMELSKLENDYYKNNKQIYNIVLLCEDIVTQLNKYTKYKNINILFDTDEEEVYVEVDMDDMSKAILTLISVVVKNSRINSTINFNIKTKESKVIVSIENFRRYNSKQHFDNYEEKILNLSISIAKLIVNMYKGKIDFKINEDDCILIEIQLDIKNNVKNDEKIIKTIDENFIYNEYKNICDL
ncbi:PAS domain-containing protein [Terrisporobacter sp.]